VLNENDVQTLDWESLTPVAPHFFFVPKDFSLQDEYEKGWSIQEVYLEFATGTGTGRDSTLVAFDPRPLTKLAGDITDPQIADKEITKRYSLKNTSGWDFFGRRESVLGTNLTTDVRRYHYRPFDIRYVLWLFWISPGTPHI